MPAHDTRHAIYAAPGSPTRTSRDTEYDAFARVTRNLGALSRQSDLSKLEHTRRLAQAIHDNRRLWSTLVADLAGDDNALPVALRARLLSLGAFVQTYSSRVLGDRASPEPLIEVNTAIMRGLRRERGPT